MPARLSSTERRLLGAAVAHAQAQEGRGRELTEEVIAASRDAVGAYYERKHCQRQMTLAELREAAAMKRLAALVGRP